MWFHELHWEASLGVLAGSDPHKSAMLGPELTFGISRKLRANSDNLLKLLGHEWGLELHGWIGFQSAPWRRSGLVGVRPWFAQSWAGEASDWLYERRHPSFFGIIVPEAGLALREETNPHGYLAWSAPFLWHRAQYYYRKYPYLLREHSALEVRPSILWVLDPLKADVRFIIGVDYRLW